MPHETQTEFLTSTGRPASQADRIYDHLVNRPCEWVSMTDLGHLVGAWAVHSRIADVRRRLAIEVGGHIENAQTVDPITGKRHSFYRYVPASLNAGGQGTEAQK